VEHSLSESVNLVSHACTTEEKNVELAVQADFVEKALVLVPVVWLPQPYLGRELQRGRWGRPHLPLSRYQREVWTRVSAMLFQVQWGRQNSAPV
jgi:hypothetical protein